MKNPITEWKTKQITAIITILEVAYNKICEELAESNVNPKAGLKTIIAHFDTLAYTTRGTLKLHVQIIRANLVAIQEENVADPVQAYVEAEHVLYGILSGYKRSPDGIARPFGLKRALENVSTKMEAEILGKQQVETRKQADLAEQMTNTLESFKVFAEKSSADIDKRHKAELTKVKLEAEMQAGLAYDSGLLEGQKAAKKEINKPIVQPLPTSKMEVKPNE